MTGWGNDPLASSDPHAAWGNDPIDKKSIKSANDNLTPAQKYAQGKYLGSTVPRIPDAAGMNLLQGATFGFGDEILAGTNALEVGASNLIDRARGKKPEFSMGEAYDAMLEQARSEEKNLPQEYPGASQTGLQLMGGIAAPGAKGAGKFIAEAPGAIGKMARGALVGAGFGGLAGFGSGEGGLGNRAGSASVGAGVGSMLGLLPPAAIAGLKAGGKLTGQAYKAFSGIFREMSGKTPEEAVKSMSPKELKLWHDKALEYVQDLIASSGKKVSDLTEDPAHKLGKPITGAEAIGRQGANQLASLGRRAGTTGDIAETQFRARGDERSDRIMGGLAQASGLKPEHVQGNMDSLSEELRSANPGNYEKAESHPPINVSEDKELLHLFSQPNMQKALKWAQTLAENEGRPWSFSKADPFLSWKDLDYVKRGLQTEINRTHKTALGQMITDDASRADLNTLDKYREHLFSLNKDYETAVGHAGEPLKLEGAYKVAPKLMSNSTSEVQFDRKINDMSHAELEATKAGWVNDIYNKLQKNKLQPKDLNSPEFQAKAKRLLGESQARRFVDEINQELRLKANEQRIPPGRQSITGELKHAGEEMDAKTDEFIEDVTDKLIRRGAKGIALAANRALWNVFRAAKTPEREALRNEVGKLLLLKPDQLRMKLEAHGKVVSPKAKEIMTMLSHVGYGVTGPATETAVQEMNQ